MDAEHTSYCPNCGQENHNPRQPLLHYVYELVEGFFHFDNKTWRTLRTLLLKPGVMTKDHIENKRARYTPPMRLFIFTLAVFIFTIVVDDNFYVKKNLGRESAIPVNRLYDELPDSVIRDIRGPFIWSKTWKIPIRDLKDLKALPASGVDDWLKNMGMPHSLFYQLRFRAQRIYMNSTETPAALETKRSRIFYGLMLIVAPVFAFFLFLCFYRRQLFYYDTLIFSLHFFVFAMLLSIILTLINLALFKIFGLNPFPVFYLTPTLCLVLYVIPAAKKVFNFSWVATITRSVVAISTTFIFMKLAEMICEAYGIY